MLNHCCRRCLLRFLLLSACAITMLQRIHGNQSSVWNVSILGWVDQALKNSYQRHCSWWADRDGNWALHLLSIQELLPVFCVSGSINYQRQRYGSWYLEKMRKLPEEYPEIYKNYLDGKFVVKIGHGHFNAVAPDMKLEQTIQRSKKEQAVSLAKQNTKLLLLNGNCAITQQVSCRNHWISSCQFGCRAPSSRTSKDFHTWVQWCRKQGGCVYQWTGNPYLTSACSTLHHFTSGQVVTHVVQAKSTCATFDELRYNIYTSKNKTLT